MDVFGVRRVTLTTAETNQGDEGGGGSGHSKRVKNREVFFFKFRKIDQILKNLSNFQKLVKKLVEYICKKFADLKNFPIQKIPFDQQKLIIFEQYKKKLRIEKKFKKWL